MIGTVLTVIDRGILLARLAVVVVRASEELIEELRAVPEDPRLARARGEAAGKAAAESSRRSGAVRR